MSICQFFAKVPLFFEILWGKFKFLINFENSKFLYSKDSCDIFLNVINFIYVAISIEIYVDYGHFLVTFLLILVTFSSFFETNL
mgnify:CR=1 FL=1